MYHLDKKKMKSEKLQNLYGNYFTRCKQKY